MNIHGAVIIEQGVTFAVIAVKQSVNPLTEAGEAPIIRSIKAKTKTRRQISVSKRRMHLVRASRDSSCGHHFGAVLLKPWGV